MQNNTTIQEKKKKKKTEKFHVKKRLRINIIVILAQNMKYQKMIKDFVLH